MIVRLGLFCGNYSCIRCFQWKTDQSIKFLLAVLHLSFPSNVK
uniref:Uncharacterized protein n=1 Tax=Tetraselmis sp. GSL018 TaxID=582737 RepID=A0A061QW09_9CHLO